MTTEYHPFTRARLLKAVRALLKDKHGHPSHQELVGCSACMRRLWGHLDEAKPLRTLRD